MFILMMKIHIWFYRLVFLRREFANVYINHHPTVWLVRYRNHDTIVMMRRCHVTNGFTWYNHDKQTGEDSFLRENFWQVSHDGLPLSYFHSRNRIDIYDDDALKFLTPPSRYNFTCYEFFASSSFYRKLK